MAVVSTADRAAVGLVIESVVTLTFRGPEASPFTNKNGEAFASVWVIHLASCGQPAVPSGGWRGKLIFLGTSETVL